MKGETDTEKQRKEEEKRKKEEEKHKKEEEKQKKEDEKRKKEEEEHKKEEEKRKKEEEKRKKDDEKRKKEEEKNKENEKKQQEKDEKRKNEEKKQQKKDDEHKKEDEKKHKKEEEKNKKDDKRQKKEEEKQKKDEIKKQKEDEKKKRQEDEKNKKEAKRKKKEEDQLKEFERKRGKTNFFRVGVCRCWYCCCAHTCLSPLLWLYGMVLFGFSLYYALMYTLKVDKKKHQLQLLLLYWGTVTYASIFIMLVQLTYLLVLFESIKECGKCMFQFLFITTLVICAAVLILSIYCPEFCPFGKPTKRHILSRSWLLSIPQQLYNIRFASAVTLCLLVFVLHIYLYNILQFTEEYQLRENKEAYCNGGKSEANTTATLPSTKDSINSKSTTATMTKYWTESDISNSNNANNNNTFAAIAERYRSRSYEQASGHPNYGQYQMNCMPYQSNFNRTRPSNFSSRFYFNC